MLDLTVADTGGVFLRLIRRCKRYTKAGCALYGRDRQILYLLWRIGRRPYCEGNIMSGKGFGWADDLDEPVDATPTNPPPPESLIGAAARAVPAILANVDPIRNHGEISLVASKLAQFLVKQ